MATLKTVIIVALSATLAQGQRPSFAGTRPIGFPELPDKSTTTADPLGNRFGESGTTERLPIEANGDRDLIERISKFPIDQQPFWYLNWKALEAQRKNPQTYPQRPSQFAETPNTSTGNINSGTLTSNPGTNSNAVPNSATLNSRFSSSNIDLANSTRLADKDIANNTNLSEGQKQLSVGYQNRHSQGFGNRQFHRAK